MNANQEPHLASRADGIADGVVHVRVKQLAHKGPRQEPIEDNVERKLSHLASGADGIADGVVDVGTAGGAADRARLGKVVGH